MTNVTELEPLPAESCWSEAVVLNVVVAYGDSFAGKRAKAVLDRLVQQLGRKVLLKCNLWKFNVQETPQLNKLAANDALEAQMIIIAAHEGTELSGPMKQWLADWLLDRDVASAALVAVLDYGHQAGGNQTPVSSYLKKLAEVGSLDFFCRQSNWSESEIGAGFDQLQRRANTVGTVLEEILHRAPSYRDWGITE